MDDEWRLDDVGSDEPVSHLLVFSEDVLISREDLVTEAIEFLETVPDIVAVERVDREAIALTADALPTSHLTEVIRGWWAVASQRQRPWMIAMDRVARTLSDLTAAYGYQRREEELVRLCDAELAHVVTLSHQFVDDPVGHAVTVTASVRIALPYHRHFTVMRYTGDLDDIVALSSAVTDRLLPALALLSTVDALLERWRNQLSLGGPGEQPYTLPDAWLHARVLVSRRRLVEARELFQQEFERCAPGERPALSRTVEELGVEPLTTATNPLLTIAEEATLATWQRETGAMVEAFRNLTGLALDRSGPSVDQLWGWLRTSPRRLQTAFADATPALAVSYYGWSKGNDIRSGRAPFEPWLRMTVELVTAYVGEVVIGEAPDTAWGVTEDGELALVQQGGTGLLSRVFTNTHEAFDAPVDEFDPRRLRRLVNDMVRWVGDANNRLPIIRLDTPTSSRRGTV